MTDLSLALEDAAKQVKTDLDRMLLAAPLPVRTYTSHLTYAHGKFIRARAVLACAMDREGVIGADAVTFAVAIELLHLATLVHDDVMDEADLRRGVETIQKRFGKRTAVICGDYLLAAAIKALAQIQEQEGYRRLDTYRYVEQICMGELRQNMNIRNFGLTMYRYLSIINGKTAALFEASCFAGALVHETSEERLVLYRRLGRYLGMVFQLTDDCIDYEQDQDFAGKNVQSDFQQGVITLPVIYTFQRKPRLKVRALKGKLLTRELLQAVADCEGVGFTHLTAIRYYEKAVAALKALKLPKGQEALIRQLLEKAVSGGKPMHMEVSRTG